ncbi:chloramphenicol resistance protein [Daldinia decipiens]|uniref:chloramphenicol resistance protein n=1 Tax=Daldinia decipiens TaxID=326647 RepID=UPI0020C4E40C|nr:chloramphenicol resistance protein [Daldinia decipiens]KAI1661235.1 chloramphenicol resistance protein [Daldinia decipiens]
MDAPKATETMDRYSVFTIAKKWCIVSMVSYAAWFSTLSSFIYFPAVHLLSEDLSVSVDKINLTITSYMAVATIAPTLVGDAADVLGRRPVYMITLSLYVVANIAIALSKSYNALLGLRVLQALAISGTFSVAYGVITDVASPAERGSFVSAVSFATPTSITIAPSLGPILGGALSYAAGWTWIFWFLSIAAGLCLITITLFLPETSRSIVGNGSIRPPKHLRLPISTLMRHWTDIDQSTEHKWRVPNPLKSLLILTRRDNAIIIFGCGLLYVVYTCINASLSVLFIDIYNLNQWQAGIIYLPFGVGGMVSTFFSGPLLDRAYRRARTKRDLSTDKAVGDDLDNFPIEKARLSVIWVPLIITTVSIIVFGWTLHYHRHISIPLILQFIAGLCMQLDFSTKLSDFKIYNTLLVDKNHRTPAAAQASSNIVRCTLAAITVSFLQNLIDALGIGWTFTFMGGLCLVVLGLFLVDYQKGTRWRQERIISDST